MSNVRVLHSGKILGLPDGNVFSCCPKMDLLAISMNKTSIWMFRFNGERVYSINNKAQVLDLQWNQSGRFFAVSGTDNYINIYETNTGELVNKFATNTSLPITLMSWSSVSMDISIASEEAMRFISMFKQDILKDLPKLSNEVNFFETERAGGIISLQPTPPKTQSLSVSATNTNTDDSTLDSLLVINANSVLSTTINNLFAIPDIELPENCTYIKHEVRQDFFTQHLLARDPKKGLVLFTMKLDIPTPRQRSYVLDILKWSSLSISMLNHITDQVSNMQHEAHQFISLFDRYLANLREAIAEGRKPRPSNDEGEEVTEDDLVFAVMQIILTGVIPTSLKDYWLNQFGERGLLRLSKVGNDLFEATRKTAYAQVILAVEKLIILLSDIRGVCLAAQNLYKDPIGLSLPTVENALALSKALLIKTYKFILEMNKEQRAFNVYCNFVKVEIIERLTKGESDWESFVKANPEIAVSTSEAMGYADNYMTSSILLPHLSLDTSSYEIMWAPDDDSEESIARALTALKSEINERLLFGVQEYIAGKAKFDEICSIVDGSDDDETHMLSSERGILIGKKSGSKLFLYSITTSGDKTISQVDFSSPIVSFDIVDSERALALLGKPNGASELILFGVPQPGTNVSYENLRKEQVRSIDLSSALQDPAIMRVTRSSTKEEISGCIFDKAKRSYAIFKI